MHRKLIARLLCTCWLKIMKTLLHCVIMLIMCVSWAYSSAFALTNEEAFAQFQFNFITPGARATALGGAFIGLADDATAVESNPAGLTILTVPEVSIEMKHLTYSSEQIYSNISLHPDDRDLDIVEKEYQDSVESVPFLSVVYPYKRVALSLYRQELVNYKSSYRTDAQQILLFETYDPSTGLISSIIPRDTSVDLTITNYGIGLALQVSENFSIAISPRRSHLKLNSHSATYGHEDMFGIIATDFSDADLRSKNSIDDEDVGYSVNAGVLWRPHPRVSIGAVYRSGPEFRVAEAVGAQDEYDPDLAEFTLNIPDSFGCGMAVRFTEFLTVTLDVLYIRYQDLLEDFDMVWNQEQGTKKNFTINNATEIHLGMEYILKIGEHYLALRAGGYYEPDHTIRFTGTTGDWREDIFRKTLFPGGDDQLHITGGLGIVLNNRFQIDAAANIAEKTSQLSISAVYRF